MLLIKQAEIYSELEHPLTPSKLMDVRCHDGAIENIAPDIKPQKGDTVINANGSALLPGLHDHHIHLFALAAAHYSIDCGPPVVNNETQLSAVLKNAEGEDWIRGISYHESVAGMLSSAQLDQWVSDRPVRIQHRSGKMWFVNSCAAQLLNLQQHHLIEGIECDNNDVPTGRLFRMDQWLREQLEKKSQLEIQSTSKLLASFGVTGITDASVTNSTQTQNLYETLMNSDQLLQKVMLMGDESLVIGKDQYSGLSRGALKILLDDAALPDYDQFKNKIHSAHQQYRPVAIHCVTTIELVFALSALNDVGTLKGDRIEHASVTNQQTIDLIRDSGVTVVTQTNFIAERGDQYAQDFNSAEYDTLYRCKTLLDVGIPVGGSTDAPYGNPDPWLAMSAAVNRETVKGKILGKEERINPEQALKLFTTSAKAPGGKMRSITIGADADFCLLDRAWSKSRRRLTSDDVVLTIRAGEIIYQK